MLRFFKCICFLALLPTFASANSAAYCEELWFARNAMLNDAGYCFSTPLGQSIFDNSDCTGRSPAFAPDVASQITFIQKLEAAGPRGVGNSQRCRVDVSQTVLDAVPYIELRQKLTFQPVPDGALAGCIGYQGDPLLIHVAPDMGAEIVGYIKAGYSLSLSHLPWNDWNFAIVQPDASRDDGIMVGWYQADVVNECGLVAG